MSGPRPASQLVSTVLSCTKRYVSQGFLEAKDFTSNKNVNTTGLISMILVFSLDVKFQNVNRRLGVKDGSEAGVPNRESKPSAHAPAPHARHDRSMARSISVARPIFRILCSSPSRRVQRPSGFKAQKLRTCLTQLDVGREPGPERQNISPKSA